MKNLSILLHSIWNKRARPETGPPREKLDARNRREDEKSLKPSRLSGRERRLKWKRKRKKDRGNKKRGRESGKGNKLSRRQNKKEEKLKWRRRNVKGSVKERKESKRKKN